MSPAQLAGILYDALADDQNEVAALRNEFKTLAKSVATDPAFGTAISSATVDGQSYAGAVVMTNLERLGMLRTFLAGVDAGARPSTRTYAHF